MPTPIKPKTPAEIMEEFDSLPHLMKADTVGVTREDLRPWFRDSMKSLLEFCVTEMPGHLTPLNLSGTQPGSRAQRNDDGCIVRNKAIDDCIAVIRKIQKSI